MVMAIGGADGVTVDGAVGMTVDGADGVTFEESASNATVAASPLLEKPPSSMLVEEDC